MIGQREDHDWTSDLMSEDAALRGEAISDLRDMLLRGLAKSLSKQGRVDDAFLEDIVQDRLSITAWATPILAQWALISRRSRDSRPTS